MKKIFTLSTAFVMSLVLIFPLGSLSQAPDKMSYQAVVRDANSSLIINSNIGIQISILQDSANGQEVYVERHFPTTNANGLVTLEIGTGIVVSGDFASINWSDGPYFVKSETDLTGGTNYTISGTSQILSVPYALHAKFADSISNLSLQLNTLSDLDGDTKVQVEETADDDIIRFDMAGFEYFRMDNGRLEFFNTGNNIFIGEEAGENDDFTDNWNVGIGYAALTSNTVGVYNNAFGANTLKSNSTGEYNNAFGNHALEYNTTGYKNTATGRQALRYNETGYHNTANGNFALQNNSTGYNNTGIGASALWDNNTGNYNTGIGFNADVGTGDLINATAVGADALVESSNSIVLGSIGGVNTATSDVNVGIGTTSPDESAILELNSDSKGFLMPRMTTSQRSTINNPSDGLLIFNTTTYRLNICIAGNWYEISLDSICLPPPTNWDTVYNPITGRYWMDRNLGASQVATEIEDNLAFGDLYQWGRFSDGHEIRTSDTTNTLATTPVPNLGNEWDSLFITSYTPPYNWLNSQSDTLWQGINGFNNPCPEGFRIPTEAEWEVERQSWTSNDKYGAFNSTLKLPAAGYRSRNGGTLWYQYGSYACSTIFGTDSYRLWFSSSNAYMQTDSNRATGVSVRCIKD